MRKVLLFLMVMPFLFSCEESEKTKDIIRATNRLETELEKQNKEVEKIINESNGLIEDLNSKLNTDSSAYKFKKLNREELDSITKQ